MESDYIQMGQPYFSDIDQIIEYARIMVQSRGYLPPSDLLECLMETKKQGYNLTRKYEGIQGPDL